MDRDGRIKDVRMLYLRLILIGMGVGLGMHYESSIKLFMAMIFLMIFVFLNYRLLFNGYVNLELNQPQRLKKIMWTAFILIGLFLMGFPFMIEIRQLWESDFLYFLYLLLVFHELFVMIELFRTDKEVPLPPN